jgi:hypothetical protein
VITVSSLSWQTARLREREHEQKKRKYTHNPSVFFVRLNIAGKARDDIVANVFQSDDTLPNEAGKRKKGLFCPFIYKRDQFTKTGSGQA